MFAIEVAEDDKNSMAWKDGFPRPVCGPGDVLIEVRATCVNRADLLQRKGLYNPPAGTTDILGLEASGVIVETGAGVDGWRVGDRVCTLLPGGGYGEFVTSPQELLLPIPEHFSFETAAAIPEVYYTAFLNLFLEGELDSHERLLIHAAASGVGTAAIQLAQAAGVETIYGTASGPKIERLEDMGIVAFNRHETNFAEEIDEVDVILDPVAAGYLDQNMSILSTGGRLVIIGLLSGRAAELDLARLLRGRIRIIGSVLRARSVAEKAEITRLFLQEAWPLFAQGHIEPIIDSVFSIENAEDAHALVRSNETFGQVVMTLP